MLLKTFARDLLRVFSVDLDIHYEENYSNPSIVFVPCSFLLHFQFCRSHTTCSREFMPILGTFLKRFSFDLKLCFVRLILKHVSQLQIFQVVECSRHFHESHVTFLPRQFCFTVFGSRSSFMFTKSTWTKNKFWYTFKLSNKNCSVTSSIASNAAFGKGFT